MTPGQRRTRTKVMISSTIFYVCLIAYIIVFILACRYGYGLLMDWLTQLEASQPDVRREEVFSELFEDPDWAKLYTMAGEEDTTYEGVQAYASYMEALVGDKELTCVETSAGLSGDKKYIVRLDKTKVAEFTLTDMAPEGEELPDWQLGTVSVFYTRTQNAYIFTVPGHTVYINGVALDDSFVIQTTSTVAEEYMQYYSTDFHGYRDMTLYIDGLLVQPNVTIQDANGNEVEVVYDAETNTYREVITELQISEEQKNILVKASQSYGKYMIVAASKADLRNYFDSTGPAYKNLPVQWELFVQNYSSYKFTEAVITDFYQYSDTLFSAHMNMQLQVTRMDGSIKEYDLSSTFFVEKSANGKWLVDRMTNVDIQETKTMVKLVYMSGNNAVSTDWVEADAKQITLPEIAAPNGKTFTGWYTKTTEGNTTSYSLVFAPSESGVLMLPSGNVLAPMVLYALFE